MISLIIPTYNELENIKKLIPHLLHNLKSLKQRFEIIIVDDNSPDMTWNIAYQYARKYNQIHVIRRMNERGLGSAVVSGFTRAKGDIIGVIDADLSHPPALISKLVRECKNYDIVIASRYIADGKEQLSGFRKITSKIATLLARPLTDVNDPMSGYFFIKKKVISKLRSHKTLNPIGYKILLEILVKGDYHNIIEIPFNFEERYLGKSKLGLKAYFEYLIHLLILYNYKISHNKSS